APRLLKIIAVVVSAVVPSVGSNAADELEGVGVMRAVPISLIAEFSAVRSAVKIFVIHFPKTHFSILLVGLEGIPQAVHQDVIYRRSGSDHQRITRRLCSAFGELRCVATEEAGLSGIWMRPSARTPNAQAFRRSLSTVDPLPADRDDLTV